VKLLVADDLSMPPWCFREAFTDVEARHAVEYLQVDAARMMESATASDDKLREYQGSPGKLAERASDVCRRYQRPACTHHITWRQLGADTDVVAREPNTNRAAGRRDARGERQHLSSGEERRYTLEIGVLAGTRDP
jgi:hypothetical protein